MSSRGMSWAPKPAQLRTFGLVLHVLAVLKLAAAVIVWGSVPGPAGQVAALIIFVVAIATWFVAVQLRSLGTYRAAPASWPEGRPE